MVINTTHFGGSSSTHTDQTKWRHKTAVQASLPKENIFAGKRHGGDPAKRI